eukprot:g9263.t1 g9263   contig36:231692-232210(-)
MWQAIKNDLQDFVRTATKEGEMAMASLDSAVEELDERLNRRDNGNADDDDLESVGGDGSVEVEDSQHKGNDAYFMGDANDVFFGTGGGEDDCEAMSPEEEAMQLSELEETYTEPLLCVTDETAKILLDESDKDGSVNDETATMTWGRTREVTHPMTAKKMRKNLNNSRFNNS